MTTKKASRMTEREILHQMQYQIRAISKELDHVADWVEGVSGMVEEMIIRWRETNDNTSTD